MFLVAGSIYQYGAPQEVINDHTLKDVFGVYAQIEIDPDNQKPFIRSMKLNKVN